MPMCELVSVYTLCLCMKFCILFTCESSWHVYICLHTCVCAQDSVYDVSVSMHTHVHVGGTVYCPYMEYTWLYVSLCLCAYLHHT